MSTTGGSLTWDDEEDDPGEDNGDLEDSLGWTEAGALAPPSSYFVNDGEQGGLSVAELDAPRAKRRPKANVERPERIGGDAQLVMVTRRPSCTICNTRPLTPDEQARYIAALKGGAA